MREILQHIVYANQRGYKKVIYDFWEITYGSKKNLFAMHSFALNSD